MVLPWGHGVRAWWRWAGESSRKPRRPRPYSRAFAGMALRSALRPKAAHRRLHTRVLCRPASPHEPVVFTTTQHAASLRSSNNCKCLIETFFIARGENPLRKRLNPYGPFSADSLLEYGGLKPILPFLEGCSDAACCVVIFLCAIPIYAHMGANDGRWQSPATISPQMPTVGAGSSQREDSPAHLPPATIRANQTWEPTVYNDAVIFNRNAAPLIATRHATSRQTPLAQRAVPLIVKRFWNEARPLATNASPQQEAVLVHLGFYLLREGF